MQDKLFFMHNVLLSIGTNTDVRFNLNRAKTKLLSYFPNIQFTVEIENKPYGENYKEWFLNTLGFFESDLCKSELISQIKDIEKSMGRSSKDKAEGKVIIDIDLIRWDNEILKPDDFKRSYIIDLLPFVSE